MSEELTVEQALKELREMFPEAKWITISGDYTIRAADAIVRSSTRIQVAIQNGFFTAPTLSEAMVNAREWNRIHARRFFCSCGGALTAEEYAEHRKMGHDSGME